MSRPILPRMQLFEFNDEHWTPAPLRDVLVEALSRTLDWGGMTRAMVEPFQRFLQESGARDILDIGSGAGGPARVLVRELERSGREAPRFILTDLHPRVEAWEQLRREHPRIIDFEPMSVDATCIPERIASGRVRCIINALHHLPPELARGVLLDAVQGSRGVFVAEGFERNPLRYLSFVPAGLPALFCTPLLSPRDRLAKALLTYASPAALAVSVWDGLVSTLRVYSEEELREMVSPLGDAFRWTYGTYDYAPFGRGTYFYGVPRDR